MPLIALKAGYNNLIKNLPSIKLVTILLNLKNEVFGNLVMTIFIVFENL